MNAPATDAYELRDTYYAEELVEPARVQFPEKGGEGRLERIRIKETNNVEIRLSWWKDGHMINRPLDLSERDLMTLLGRAVTLGVLRLQEE